MEVINKDFKDNILEYMGQRYPITGQAEISRQLEKAVKETDNLEALNNDLLLKSGIKFELRESGNYNDLIMRMLNYVIETVNQSVNDDGETSTNFKIFEAEMIKIFDSIYIPE